MPVLGLSARAVGSAASLLRGLVLGDRNMRTWRCPECKHYHVDKGCKNCPTCPYYEARVGLDKLGWRD